MKLEGFIWGSYQSASKTADYERTVNWYFEVMESPNAGTRAALYPTPGVEILSSPGLGPGRAHFAEDGREWAVLGTTFGEIDQAGTFTTIGTVAIDSNPATISSNGDGGSELFITSGGNGYLYDTSTSTFSTIAALASKATIGGQLNGYFVAFDANTSTIYLSDLLDGTTWDPTQFAQRSIASDPWISMKIKPPFIWLLGTHTSEVWFDSGAFPFPFEPHPSGLIPYGCAAAFSPVVAEGSIVWLARSEVGTGVVLRSIGFSPERISTQPVQSAMQSYGSISNAIGDAYDDEGHTFYMISVPNAGITWCWDAQNGMWTERGTWISASNAYVAWRPRHHAFEFGQHRWLDSNTGDILRSSVSLTLDVDSLPIRRLRRAPVLVAENKRVFYSSFEIFLESGLGTQTGQGADPQVMMRFSNDGGRTWSSERLASAGKVGEYLTRVQWHRMGAARWRVFEVSVSDPIPWRMMDAFIEVKDNLRRAS